MNWLWFGVGRSAETRDAAAVDLRGAGCIIDQQSAARAGKRRFTFSLPLLLRSGAVPFADLDDSARRSPPRPLTMFEQAGRPRRSRTTRPELVTAPVTMIWPTAQRLDRRAPLRSCRRSA